MALVVHGDLVISTHALREEGDFFFLAFIRDQEYFYPRPPRGGRLPKRQRCSQDILEFLPTPSARRATLGRRRADGCPDDFYPRPPRGGRRSQLSEMSHSTIFLPTPSARRATPFCTKNTWMCCISTHALREEGDFIVLDGRIYQLIFLPTPSARRATHGAIVLLLDVKDFYPRPPRGGRPR